MKKIQATTYLETLQTDTRQLMSRLAQLKQLPADIQVQQPAPGRWSVAQVIEHLNTYGRFYLPELERSINAHNDTATEWFVSGWLGGYFTNSMRPKADGTITHKMKTVKNHNPEPVLNGLKVLGEFEQQEILLLQLLDKAQQVDISRIRIPLSITPLFKLKMGDVFGFIVAHHQRHFVQIENTLKAIGNGE
ncbi:MULTISPECIES: DinB family protein [Niastella]|uniref:DinB family protein n=1 Tax=Niastella soli TaxID=2821487 RepID=A0ABS3YRA0_9BACT|nr:DinB family protein [Niastella soli]MBO9200432.1 DinB family protein [Niastella soli]